MGLDAKSVEPAYGFHKVSAIDAEVAVAEARIAELQRQRKLYEPAARKYAAEQKKAQRAEASSASDEG